MRARVRADRYRPEKARHDTSAIYREVEGARLARGTSQALMGTRSPTAGMGVSRSPVVQIAVVRLRLPAITHVLMSLLSSPASFSCCPPGVQLCSPGKPGINPGAVVALRGCWTAARAFAVPAPLVLPSGGLARCQSRTAPIAVFRPRRRPVAGSVPAKPGPSWANIRSLRVCVHASTSRTAAHLWS